MSEANRDESDRCKTIAQSALRSGDTEKATRFLQKAKRMSPGDSSIDELLERIASGEFSNAGGGSAQESSTRSPSSSMGAEGPRKRATAAPSSGASSQERTSKSGKSYTAEQMQEVQRILRTKDYYDILGVPKDAPEEAVKKAYKKMALKLHPDKNQAPGAEEAFKKVSKAVQCLTDEDKKAVYDRYGDEDRIPEQHRRHYQQDFVGPEDIFNAFFGGGAFHTHFHHGHHGHHRGDADPQQVQRAQLIQMLPVLLLLFLTLASNLAGRDGTPRFSFTANGMYQNERATATLNVPYYVSNDFEEHYHEGTKSLADFEKTVDIYYVRHLHSECDYQEKVMYKKVMLAKRRNNQDELENARNFPRPACKEIEKIKRRHHGMYRAAMHMGYA